MLLFAPDFTEGPTESCSVRAELGDEVSLRIRLIHSNTVAASFSDPGGSGWAVGLGAML